MRRMIRISALAVALTLALFATGCLEKKVIQVVVTSETFADFQEYSEAATFATPATVDICADIDEALADAGYSKSDIIAIKVVGGHYGVTSYNGQTNWVITGSVEIERTDIGPTSAELVSYSSQSVPAAKGKKIKAPLTKNGIDILQGAINDWLADNNNPVLTFTTNGNVSPTPDSGNPIEFDWRVWVTVHVILEESVELPDPF